MQFPTADSVTNPSKLKFTFSHLNKILKFIRMPLTRGYAAMQLHEPYQQCILKVTCNFFKAIPIDIRIFHFKKQLNVEQQISKCVLLSNTLIIWSVPLRKINPCSLSTNRIMHQVTVQRINAQKEKEKTLVHQRKTGGERHPLRNSNGTLPYV